MRAKTLEIDIFIDMWTLGYSSFWSAFGLLSLVYVCTYGLSVRGKSSWVAGSLDVPRRRSKPREHQSSPDAG